MLLAANMVSKQQSIENTGKEEFIGWHDRRLSHISYSFFEWNYYTFFV